MVIWYIFILDSAMRLSFHPRLSVCHHLCVTIIVTVTATHCPCHHHCQYHCPCPHTFTITVSVIVSAVNITVPVTMSLTINDIVTVTITLSLTVTITITITVINFTVTVTITVTITASVPILSCTVTVLSRSLPPSSSLLLLRDFYPPDACDIERIDLGMYWTICANLYYGIFTQVIHSIACVIMSNLAKIASVDEP